MTTSSSCSGCCEKCYNSCSCSSNALDDAFDLETALCASKVAPPARRGRRRTVPDNRAKRPFAKAR